MTFGSVSKLLKRKKKNVTEQNLLLSLGSKAGGTIDAGTLFLVLRNKESRR